MDTIGNRIRARRQELQMSQEELALKIGMKSRSSINKIEMNARNLTQSRIKLIADALQTTPSWIMGWEDNVTEDTQDAIKKAAEDAARIKRLDRLTPDELALVDNLINTLLAAHDK